MIKRPSRPLLFGSLIVLALVAGGIALTSRPSAAAPVTVYLTPT
jgi:hypothetical protein